MPDLADLSDLATLYNYGKTRLEKTLSEHAVILTTQPLIFYLSLRKTAVEK